MGRRKKEMDDVKSTSTSFNISPEFADIIPHLDLDTVVVMGGGVINFQMEIEGMSYPDAVRALAKRVGMEVPEDAQYQSRYRQQERLWALSKEAARFYHTQLYAEAGKEGYVFLE